MKVFPVSLHSHWLVNAFVLFGVPYMVFDIYAMYLSHYHTEAQRSFQLIQRPLSSDSEGFSHQGLHVGSSSYGLASHFHAHHSGENIEESLPLCVFRLTCH